MLKKRRVPVNRSLKCLILAGVAALFLCVPLYVRAASTIIDHTRTNITSITEQAILDAKSKLHIAYGHTSHGSQVTDGMSDLVGFANNHGKGLNLPANIFAWNDGGAGGALDIDDYFVGSNDLGNPDFTTWATLTRDYLNTSTNSDVNVVMWSWCGEVSGASTADINTYLGLMSGLETDFPNVKFVYMTGHLDGSGLTGNLHLRNDQIRNYCLANGKILYDFEDIESYNPDGVYFGDKNPTDACDYTSGGNTYNWAQQWQDSHILGTDWYDCSAAHTQPLNGNQKAYAAWALWTDLAQVPEPGSVVLLASGLAGLFGYAFLRRRRRTA
jgi:hypothetical protein